MNGLKPKFSMFVLALLDSLGGSLQTKEKKLRSKPRLPDMLQCLWLTRNMLIKYLFATGPRQETHR